MTFANRLKSATSVALATFLLFLASCSTAVPMDTVMTAQPALPPIQPRSMTVAPGQTMQFSPPSAMFPIGADASRLYAVTGYALADGSPVAFPFSNTLPSSVTVYPVYQELDQVVTLDGTTIVSQSGRSTLRDPSVRNLALPDGVTGIGPMAFCSTMADGSTAMLDSLFLPSGPTQYSAGALFLMGQEHLGSVVVPASLVFDPDEMLSGGVAMAFAGTDTLCALPAAGHPQLSSRRGMLFADDGKTLVHCPTSALFQGRAIIPSGTRLIAPLSFYLTALTPFQASPLTAQFSFAGKPFSVTMPLNDVAIAPFAFAVSALEGTLDLKANNPLVPSPYLQADAGLGIVALTYVTKVLASIPSGASSQFYLDDRLPSPDMPSALTLGTVRQDNAHAVASAAASVAAATCLGLPLGIPLSVGSQFVTSDGKRRIESISPSSMASDITLPSGTTSVAPQALAFLPDGSSISIPWRRGKLEGFPWGALGLRPTWVDAEGQWDSDPDAR